MRFAIEDLPADVFPDVPTPGDVFVAKGGNGETALWLMVSESPSRQSGHYLGLSAQGEIVSTASYANHAMRGRQKIGRVDLTEIVIPVAAI